MSSTGAWTVIVLAGAGTFLIRFTFLSVAHRATELPEQVMRVLRMIPPAALAALVATGAATDAGAIDLDPARLVAVAVAGLAAWRTRSIAATVIVGMPVLMLLDRL